MKNKILKAVCSDVLTVKEISAFFRICEVPWRAEQRRIPQFWDKKIKNYSCDIPQDQLICFQPKPVPEGEKPLRGPNLKVTENGRYASSPAMGEACAG